MRSGANFERSMLDIANDILWFRDGDLGRYFVVLTRHAIGNWILTDPKAALEEQRVGNYVSDPAHLVLRSQVDHRVRHNGQAERRLGRQIWAGAFNGAIGTMMHSEASSLVWRHWRSGSLVEETERLKRKLHADPLCDPSGAYVTAYSPVLARDRDLHAAAEDIMAWNWAAMETLFFGADGGPSVESPSHPFHVFVRRGYGVKDAEWEGLSSEMRAMYFTKFREALWSLTAQQTHSFVCVFGDITDWSFGEDVEGDAAVTTVEHVHLSHFAHLREVSLMAESDKFTLHSAMRSDSSWAFEWHARQGTDPLTWTPELVRKPDRTLNGFVIPIHTYASMADIAVPPGRCPAPYSYGAPVRHEQIAGRVNGLLEATGAVVQGPSVPYVYPLLMGTFVTSTIGTPHFVRKWGINAEGSALPATYRTRAEQLAATKAFPYRHNELYLSPTIADLLIRSDVDRAIEKSSPDAVAAHVAASDALFLFAEAVAMNHDSPHLERWLRTAAKDPRSSYFLNGVCSSPQISQIRDALSWVGPSLGERLGQSINAGIDQLDMGSVAAGRLADELIATARGSSRGLSLADGQARELA